MILASHFDILAAAAGPSEYSFGHGSVWTDLLASALTGLVLLPFALFFMWGFHKARLDRWFVLTAVLATILSVVATEIMNAYLWGIYAFAEDVLHVMGVHRWMYMVFPNLLVCLFGALGFGWWLKRHRRDDVSGIAE
mgnify:CR=1 FL=1